jgi:hypothetical protein
MVAYDLSDHLRRRLLKMSTSDNQEACLLKCSDGCCFLVGELVCLRGGLNLGGVSCSGKKGTGFVLTPS